jgi:hypothetical protein
VENGEGCFCPKDGELTLFPDIFGALTKISLVHAPKCNWYIFKTQFGALSKINLVQKLKCI